MTTVFQTCSSIVTLNKQDPLQKHRRPLPSCALLFTLGVTGLSRNLTEAKFLLRFLKVADGEMSKKQMGKSLSTCPSESPKTETLGQNKQKGTNTSAGLRLTMVRFVSCDPAINLTVTIVQRLPDR